VIFDAVERRRGFGKGGVENPGQNIFIVEIRLKWTADDAAHLSAVRTDYPTSLPFW